MTDQKQKPAEAGLCQRKTCQACLRRRTMPMPASALPNRISVPGSGTLFKRASQGQFSIEDRDASTPHIKRVRVVSTLEYYLQN